MKKILLGIVVLFAICTCVFQFPRLIGSHGTMQLNVLFTDRNGLACTHPCLFGIEPGLNSIAESLALLRVHPFASQLNVIVVPGKTQTFSVNHADKLTVLIYSDDNNTVSRIVLINFGRENAEGTWSNLGQVVAAFGPPDRVGAGHSLVASYYTHQHIMFFHSMETPDHLGVNDHFESVSLYTQPPSALSMALPWQGFTRSQLNE